MWTRRHLYSGLLYAEPACLATLLSCFLSTHQFQHKSTTVCGLAKPENIPLDTVYRIKTQTSGSKTNLSISNRYFPTSV